MPTAQVVTETLQKHTTIKLLTLDWLSTDAGVVSGTTTNQIDGIIYRVVFIPDAAATQPSDLYDLVIYAYGTTIDLLAGAGANLSNATATTVIPLLNDQAGNKFFPPVVCDRLTYSITNAGDAKGGIIQIYYR